MALEPLIPGTAEAGGELADMTRRFWIGLALSVPVIVAGMGADLVGLGSGVGSNWLQLVFATVLGAYFIKKYGYKAGLSIVGALAVPVMMLGGRKDDSADQSTQERLWRLPLGADYDKLIDSKNADMKNIGGRYGGAIIAAQFLQRFVKDTPWAHLDIAGTAMGAPSSEINQSWGSGFGVRLLDRLVRDHYEG